MKMWRKQAMKSGKRTGRQIKSSFQMQDMMFRRLPKTYPLLDKLFRNGGLTATVVAPTPVTPQVEEATNEAV